VARYRKTAIAALAASTLLLTPSAAYADHNHRGVSAGSDRGMNWAHFSGGVIDYTTDPDPFTDKPNIFQDARASAIMIGMGDKSLIRLRVAGIDAKDDTYGVHLHEGTCEAGYPGKAGPHYNVAWYPELPPIPPAKVNKKNEVWLDLKVDSDGDARSTATVSFIPEEGTRSIVLHADPTSESGSAGARLACLPFKIKVYGN
jgi:Copper/zinc superoxide dismutase (SODC)